MIHSELLAYCPAPGVITTADEYSPQFGSIPDDKASEDHTVPGVQIHAIYGLLFQEVVALQQVEFHPWGWSGLANDERGMREIDLIDQSQ